MDQSQFYSVSDFVSISKIDAHVHVNTNDPSFVKQAEQDNFILLSINTEVPEYVSIQEQQDYILHHQKQFSGRLYHLTTFETIARNDSDWHKSVLKYLQSSISKGAVGIKVWKNIGMALKDGAGKFIQIDDPMFDPIFDFLVEHGIPVCGHIGEPKNCWLSLDEMTVNNDKEYYRNHPEFHMYFHPEFPSYEELVESRDRLLEKHPKLKFIGAHLGSLEWSVNELAKRLDRFPGMAVDLSSRMCHLQHQSIEGWQKVYDFFIKYQDRILYGTDTQTEKSDDQEKLAEEVHELWVEDWQYLTTDDEMEVSKVNGKFKGLKLPKSVVDKIYYHNAIAWYPRINSSSL